MEPTPIEKIRHSLSHIMTMAVLERFPKAGLGVGPAIDDGFYQDYDLPEKLSDADLPAIEKRMKELLKKHLDFTRVLKPKAEALAHYAHDPYKREMIEEFYPEADAQVQLYETGGVLNLCKGGHVENTKNIPSTAFTLTHVAGAYWRGDEHKPQLQRIYGVAFETKDELAAYEHRVAEAAKRDHRKLGADLDLFMFSPLVGPGLPLFTPRGTVVREEIRKYSEELQRAMGYEFVHTPNINKGELFKISGHYEKFRDDMFLVTSNYSKEEYFLKPMNCPQATQLYARTKRSYRELPIRYADFANLYRDEKPGELVGLTRLRAFSQDDSHAFCREDQIEAEFSAILDAIMTMLRTYGLEPAIRLSLRDESAKEKYLGTDAVWEKSQALMRKLLREKNITFVEAEGDAAFYGPKMDVIATTAIGHEFQISTIQLDFNQPERFGLSYTDEDGKDQRPVMIHKAMVGSLERFMGILIEHFAGNFPVWLAPVQVQIISVGVDHIEAAHAMAKEFRGAGVRVTVDDANESVGKKIRSAEKMRVPYMLVLGDKEISSDNLQIRVRGRDDILAVPRNEFVRTVTAAIFHRAPTL